jgi:8-hydroxy-5-deazaflavin:NADPH oxidoreductase
VQQAQQQNSGGHRRCIAQAAAAWLPVRAHAAGLDALDVGALAFARELEALGFLQIKLAASEQIGWTGGFAVVR